MSSNARDVILVCAGGFGREVRAWLTQYEASSRLLGFIDDSSAEQCLGPISGHQPRPEVTYLVTNGAGKHRRTIGEALRRSGARIGSLISPWSQRTTSFVDEDAALILGNASIAANCRVGRYLLLQGFACIGHDVVIGEGCTISSFAFIGGHVSLGDEVTVHPHAVVIPNIKVGDGAVIGAGSVVTRDVPAGATVFGVPAKLISQR